MSFRLVFDAADLHATADLLEQAVEVARQVEGDSGRLAGSVADYGHDGLRDACDSFLKAWGYGMGLVAEEADGLGNVLRETVTTYEAVDQAGAEALSAVGGGG